MCSQVFKLFKRKKQKPRDLQKDCCMIIIQNGFNDLSAHKYLKEKKMETT